MATGRHAASESGEPTIYEQHLGGSEEPTGRTAAASENEEHRLHAQNGDGSQNPTGRVKQAPPVRRYLPNGTTKVVRAARTDTGSMTAVEVAETKDTGPTGQPSAAPPSRDDRFRRR